MREQHSFLQISQAFYVSYMYNRPRVHNTLIRIRGAGSGIMFSKYLQYECIDFHEVLTTFSGNHFKGNDCIEMRIIIQCLLVAVLILILILILI